MASLVAALITLCVVLVIVAGFFLWSWRDAEAEVTDLEERLDQALGWKDAPVTTTGPATIWWEARLVTEPSRPSLVLLPGGEQ